MDYELRFIKALMFTVCIETCVLWLLLRYVVRDRSIRWGRVVAAGILCSFSTLPYLWFVLPRWLPSRLALMTVGEISVTAVESLILWLLLPLKSRQALLLSVCCNGISFSLGLLFF